MRKLLIVSLALNAAGLAVAVRGVYLRGGWQYVRDRMHGQGAMGAADPDAVLYAHRQTLFERLPVQDRAIIFLGDSLTANCEWSELFPGVLNRGIGGDTTVGILKRLATIARLRPRAVFLLIGSNDRLNLGIPPAETAANVGRIVAGLRQLSPDTEAIYVESLLPTGETAKNLHALAVNERLRQLVYGKEVIYLDFYRPFLDGTVLNPRFTSDGNHLNGEGYLLWKKLLDPYMERWEAAPASRAAAARRRASY
jgi:lysophospholipase L1-like esterase